MPRKGHFFFAHFSARQKIGYSTKKKVLYHIFSRNDAVFLYFMKMWYSTLYIRRGGFLKKIFESEVIYSYGAINK